MRSPQAHRFIPFAADKTASLSHWVEPLNSFLMAQIGLDGSLIEANAGFKRLTRTADDPTVQNPDVRSFFLNPSFEDLLAVQAPRGEPVFSGILNVTDQFGVCRSLRGVVHHLENGFVILAEYDVFEMERLNAQVIELNLELAALQRNLMQANRKLQANEKELTQLSVLDPLTGLANRRRLMDFLTENWQRRQRFKSTFSVIMADIDFFKRVNDEHGHDQGDFVLKSVATQMQNMVRSVDLVARLGGEEFVVVMPEAPVHAALDLANRLQQAVSGLQFEQIPAGIRCSYGVAQLADDETVEQLLKRADLALYQSKREGRNRVTQYQAVD